MKPTNKNFEIKGLKDVEDALRTMPAALQAEILKRTNRDILNKLLKPKLKQGPGTQKSALGQKVKATYSRSDKTAVTMGISSDYWYLRFIDKGTKERRRKKSGASLGRIIGNNRFTSTIENSSDPVIKEVRENYSEIVLKHLNKKITQVNKKISKL